MHVNRYFNFRYYYHTSAGDDGFSTINVEGAVFPGEEFLRFNAKEKIKKALEISDDIQITVIIQGWNEFRNRKDYEQYIGRPK